MIVGSTRANRFSEKPAHWIYDLAKARAELEVELLDLRDYSLPFFEEPLPPDIARDNYTNPEIVRWRDKIREADGFIICSPEYNHGYPAVLKNAPRAPRHLAPGNKNSQAGPFARAKRRSSVASGSWSASATATYQAS